MPRLSSKDRYTKEVFELFKERGLSTNMDGIAAHLGITKKTLYNNYESKQDLIATVLYYFYSQLEAKINVAISTSTNAIEELFSASEVVCNELSSLGPKLLKDISMYQACPEIFKFVDRKSFYAALIRKNLKRGIEEKLYRHNVNSEYAVIFYMAIIGMFYHWDEKFYFFDDSVNFHRELVIQHLYSVVNDSGFKILECCLSK